MRLDIMHMAAGSYRFSQIFWLLLLFTSTLAATSFASTDESAATGADVPWDSTRLGSLDLNSATRTDNWCNMPRVKGETYVTPADDYTLVYVEVIQRHHKRTPYGSNLFYQEDAEWDCRGIGPLYGLRSQTHRGAVAPTVQWQNYVDIRNPFINNTKSTIATSNCQFPQLTSEGLEDSITHGSDLRDVYGPRLQLADNLDTRETVFRVTNNPITSQVASGVLQGFYPSDTLEPRYSCPRADALRRSYTTGVNGSAWKYHLQQAHDDGTFQELDRISGISPDDEEWHVSFDHYFDNLRARECHSKPRPCSALNSSQCVTQELADRVYEIGSWEYSYIYRDAPGSVEYASLRFGAWMLELEGRLQDVISGTSQVKYTHNIAHDGSISALLGFLQVSEMAWPGMGSEVIFELYKRPASSGQWCLRVLWGGNIMQTSTSLKALNLIPLEEFSKYIHSLVPNGPWLREACTQPT